MAEFIRNSKVYSTIVGQKAYILVSDKNIIAELNATGSLIWKILKDKKELENIINNIIHYYSLEAKERSRVRKETLTFLFSLKKLHLINEY